jgi:DNA-binding beta-propeller fold protein YncE
MRTNIVKALVGIGVVLIALGVGRIALPPYALAAGLFNPVLPLQVSTIPSNGDQNPYGLAFVPFLFASSSALRPGQILVSNFNDQTTQGLGTTIISIDPNSGYTGLFFQGGSAIGFTNALTIASVGLVFAGSLPTSDGNPEPGPLYVFDRNGNIVTQLGSTALVDGPWGMALNDRGTTAQLFISNIFNSSHGFDGTITRLEVVLSSGSINVLKATTIASGYTSHADTAGVVVGPAGLAYDSNRDMLYVAAEGDDAIYMLNGAGHATGSLGKGQLIYGDQTVLHGPLGLLIAPNGNLITANADPAAFQPGSDTGEIIEITRTGRLVRTFSIDPNAGSAFAIAIANKRSVNQFAYVDDFVSNCTIWNLPFSGLF